MSDILSTFYESRYSNKKSAFRLITQKDTEKNDIKLKTLGKFTIIPDSELFPPFTPDYIKSNKNLGDIHNLLHLPSAPISFLSNSNSASCMNYSKAAKQKEAKKYRDKIKKEAQLRCENLLLSETGRESSCQPKYIHPNKTAFTKQMIDPLSNIKNNLSIDPNSASLTKSNNLLLKCLGDAHYRDYLLKGVSKYKAEVEKYRPINVNQTESLFDKKALSNSSKKRVKLMNGLIEKPFRFHDSPSQKIKIKMAKYPINLLQLPSVSKCSFDERLQMTVNMCMNLKHLSNKQYEFTPDSQINKT